MKIMMGAFLLLLVSIPPLLFAQSYTVSGCVMDRDSTALPGVSVMIKGTKAFIITSAKGLFKIPVGKANDTLVFFLAGYQQAYCRVTTKRDQRFTIILHPLSAPLAEVVIAPAYAARSEADVALKTRVRGIVTGYKTDAVYRSKPAAVIRTGELEKKAGNGRPNLLTAGEVSDFKKWKLWEDYTAASFAQVSTQWGLFLKERFCVQVQNQQQVALAGEKVYLLTAGAKDTVWEAVTDNTGKAELWGNVFGNGLEKKPYSIACKENVIARPLQFEDGINRITLSRPCNVSDIVELAFVVDATGSMSDEISYLQEELQDIIAKSSARYKEVRLRSAAVFYRDHSDEYLTRHIDFTTDPAAFIGFVKQQRAAGGGDYPEAVEDALSTALDSLSWSATARTKILFLVLDAPPHDKAKQRVAQLVKRAAKEGVRVVPVVCSGVDKSTEYLMRSIALATNGTYVFLTDDSGIGNSHIKPTTDLFKVELLNDLLQRVISEMVFVPQCGQNRRDEPIGEPITTIKVSVFPNPSRGIVHIDASEVIKEMLVTDFTGKVLMHLIPSTKKGRIQLDLSHYPTGTYLLKYHVIDKGWGSEKILLMH